MKLLQLTLIIFNDYNFHKEIDNFKLNKILRSSYSSHQLMRIRSICKAVKES